jgi:hypothetical protein
MTLKTKSKGLGWSAGPEDPTPLASAASALNTPHLCSTSTLAEQLAALPACQGFSTSHRAHGYFLVMGSLRPSLPT